MSGLFMSVREACGPGVDDQLSASREPGLVREALDAELPSVLRHMVARTYVSELHRFRERAGLPVDAESSQASDAFHEQLTGDTVAAWFAQLPVLKRLLRTVVSRRVAELDRTATAIRAELAGGSLVRAGILPDGHGDIARIRALGSDLHNGGRSVCAVTLTCGESVVYKPRPLAVERVAARVFAQVASGRNKKRKVTRQERSQSGTSRREQ